jgi:hypothetical protein
MHSSTKTPTPSQQMAVILSVDLAGSWCDWKENHTPLVECGTGPNNYPGDWVAMYKMKVSARQAWVEHLPNLAHSDGCCLHCRW